MAQKVLMLKGGQAHRPARDVYHALHYEVHGTRREVWRGLLFVLDSTLEVCTDEGTADTRRGLSHPLATARACFPTLQMT